MSKLGISSHPHFAALYRSLIINHQLATFNQSALRVLDVGCDDGYLMRQISAQLRVGVDLQPRLRPDAAIKVVCASAERLPALTGSFDYVLAFDILEHVADDRALMREMTRVLSPQGVIWFSTPALDFRMIPAFLTARANCAFGHVRNGYTPTQLIALLPNPSEWLLEYFYWNEPIFRFAFSPLHFIDLWWPSLAAQLTRLAYQLDRRLAQGECGHLLGSIRRC